MNLVILRGAQVIKEVPVVRYVDRVVTQRIPITRIVERVVEVMCVRACSRALACVRVFVCV